MSTQEEESGSVKTEEEAHVNSLKKQLDKAREKLSQDLRKTPGITTCREYSTSIQDILLSHINWVADRQESQCFRDRIAIVAVGGLGRLDMALHSDLDFLFLTVDDPTQEDEEFIKSLLYPLWNLRLDLGYGVHSQKDVLEAVGTDMEKSTALSEARFLWGNEDVCTRVITSAHTELNHIKRLWAVESLTQGTKDRHLQNANTVFLLEPDVKHSVGGLRDIHVILWLSFVLFGEASLEKLVEQEIISEVEKVKIYAAWSYLLDLRNSLHLSESRRVDKLTLERQISVAGVMKIFQTNTALAEEGMMRSYYDHACVISRFSRRVRKAALVDTPGTRESLTAVELPRRIGINFWRAGDRIWIDEEELPVIDEDRFWPLRFFLAIARNDLEPTDDSLVFIEERLARIDDHYRRSPIARDYFLDILRSHGNIADTLRIMNRCGFLSKYIPEFSYIRNLPRIDHYHQYTVDEHMIRCIGFAERLHSSIPLPGMDHLADVARRILRTDLLHLALLLHDVGKGMGRGHVIHGMHAAQRVTERMQMRPVERDFVRSLIGHHQKMSHMALRRDIEDPHLGEELAEAVEKPELLDMLYVHSACDLAGVSEESWNDWRGRLISMLFDRTHEILRGIKVVQRKKVPIDNIREQIWEKVVAIRNEKEYTRDDLDHYLNDMPGRYVQSVFPPDIAKHFVLSEELDDEKRILFRTDTYEGSNYTEVTFVASDSPGLFSNLCGALSAKSFDILSAQIYTSASGEAVDIFQVKVPPAHSGNLDRILQKFCEQLQRCMETGESPTWSKTLKKLKAAPVTEERLRIKPPRVDISNSTSHSHTVIEVRAPDRPGLLNDITKLFDRFSINLDLAFIATESYQVVDVFYVTDLETNKLEEGGKMKALREELLKIVHEGLGFS